MWRSLKGPPKGRRLHLLRSSFVQLRVRVVARTPDTAGFKLCQCPVLLTIASHLQPWQEREVPIRPGLLSSCISWQCNQRVSCLNSCLSVSKKKKTVQSLCRRFGRDQKQGNVWGACRRSLWAACRRSAPRKPLAWKAKGKRGNRSFHIPRQKKVCLEF